MDFSRNNGIVTPVSFDVPKVTISNEVVYRTLGTLSDDEIRARLRTLREKPGACDGVSRNVRDFLDSLADGLPQGEEHMPESDGELDRPDRAIDPEMQDEDEDKRPEIPVHVTIEFPEAETQADRELLNKIRRIIDKRKTRSLILGRYSLISGRIVLYIRSILNQSHSDPCANFERDLSETLAHEYFHALQHHCCSSKQQ